MLLVGVQDHLGVGTRFESVAPRYQIVRQVCVIVNLSVKDDHRGPVLVEDGLPASSQIDDAQAAVTQPHIPVNEIPFVVRAPVVQGPRHSLKKPGIHLVICIEIHDPANPAHNPLRLSHDFINTVTSFRPSGAKAGSEFSLQAALIRRSLKPELHACFGGQPRVQVRSSAFRLH